MSKERLKKEQLSPITLDEKSQSEHRLEPSASPLSSQEQKNVDAEPAFLVEYGDSRRPSISANEGELGSVPPIGEHPRKSLGSVDYGDPGPEKSEPPSAVPLSGDQVDIRKEFLEGIWSVSEESPPKSPIALPSFPEDADGGIRLKSLESISPVEDKDVKKAPLLLPSERQRKPSKDEGSVSQKDDETSVQSSTTWSTTLTTTKMRTTTGSTSKSGGSEDTEKMPGPPPPTQASTKGRALKESSKSRSSSSGSSRTESTSESVSAESEEQGKDDINSPLLPKDEKDIKGTEPLKISAAPPRTKGIKSAEKPTLSRQIKEELPQKPPSSSSPVKTSTTRPTSDTADHTRASGDAKATSSSRTVPAEKKASEYSSRKSRGNDPAYYAWSNNEAHRESERRNRQIPCRLLVLNVIVAAVVILIYHLLLIRELERRSQEAREALLRPTDLSGDHVCRDVQCSAAGTHLFYVLNTSTDPCRSVYDYVCKSWMHLPPTSYRKVVLGAERLFVDSKYAEMDNALRASAILSSPSIAVRKAALLYRDCLQEAEKSRGGEENLKNLLRSYDMGAWPFAGNIFPEPYESLGKIIRDTGVGALISIKVVPDPKNPKTGITAMDCSTFAVPIGVLLAFTEHTHTTLRGYKKYISEAISALHSDRNDIDHIAANIMEFEINLAHRCNRGCRKRKYKEMSLDTLTKEAGKEWETFLAEIFSGNFSRPSETRVLVRSLAYLKVLSTAVFKNKASLRRAFNYIGWRVTHHFMRQAGMTFRSLTNKFNENFLKVEPLPKWRTCLTDINDVMPLAIGSVFVDNGLWRDNQFKASRIVASLLEVLSIMFQRWSEDGTRSTFSDLKNKMEFVISYPIWIKHPPTLDAYYGGLKDKGDYFDRYVTASRVHYKNYLSPANGNQRHRPLAEYIFPSRIVDLQLRSGPARENVFYDARENILVLPAGALQPPYYDVNTPLGLAFGGIGTLVARDLVNELFHTPEGVLKEDQSKSVFKKKSKCLLDGMKQGLSSNASLDCSSIVTDVFTLRVAFEGYHIFIGAEGDTTLQGVAQLTPDQLFFISAVRTLCTSIRERHFAEVVLLKKSVPEMQLIDSAIMQMREFDDAFDCGKKDSAILKVNLFNKCVYSNS